MHMFQLAQPSMLLRLRKWAEILRTSFFRLKVKKKVITEGASVVLVTLRYSDDDLFKHRGTDIENLMKRRRTFRQLPLALVSFCSLQSHCLALDHTCKAC